MSTNSITAATRKKQLAEKLLHGVLTKEEMEELGQINQKERETFDSLAELVKNNHISAAMILSAQHLGQPLFDRSELQLAQQWLNESLSHKPDDSTAMKAKATSRSYTQRKGIELFSVRKADKSAGMPKIVMAGDKLPKSMPKSFEFAFQGKSAKEVEEALLKEHRSNTSDEANAYLASDAGIEQVKELVSYIVQGQRNASTTT